MIREVEEVSNKLELQKCKEKFCQNYFHRIHRISHSSNYCVSGSLWRKNQSKWVGRGMFPLELPWWIASFDFRLKSMVLLHDSTATRHFAQKKKKKSGDAVLKFWLTTRGDGSRILATLGLFLPLPTYSTARVTFRSAFIVQWIWVLRPLFLGLVGKRE